MTTPAVRASRVQQRSAAGAQTRPATAAVVSRAATAARFGSTGAARMASKLGTKPAGASKHTAASSSNGISSGTRLLRGSHMAAQLMARPMARTTPSAARIDNAVPARQNAIVRIGPAAVGVVAWKAAMAVPARNTAARKKADSGSRARCSDRPGGPSGRASAVAAVPVSSGGRHNSRPRPLNMVARNPQAASGRAAAPVPSRSRATTSTVRNRSIGSITGNRVSSPIGFGGHGQRLVNTPGQLTDSGGRTKTGRV
jgi:hypothetical protein